MSASPPPQPPWDATFKRGPSHGITIAGWGGVVRIWDPVTGQQTGSLTGHFGRVQALAVAPDGKWLVTSGTDETVRIWDKASARETRAFDIKIAGDGRAAVAIAPDGTWLAAIDWDKVRIWEPVTGRQTGTLAGHAGWVHALAVAPNGTWLVGCGDRTIWVWDKASGQILTTMRMDGTPNSCTWMPDGTGLVIGGDRGTYFYDFRPGTPSV